MSGPKIAILFVILALGGLSIIIFLDDSYFYTAESIQDYNYGELRMNESLRTLNLSSTSNDTEKILLDYCNLPELDPWDPMIAPFISPQQDPALTCKPKVQQITKLIDGQLFTYATNLKCQRRCLVSKDDYNLDFGEWIDIVNGSRPQCDVMEVECRAPKVPSPVYKILHAQTYRPEPPASTRESPEKFDVHIILFDSVSESQFIRAMPKTQYLLREYYESVTFRHLNKIGLNSRPNGFGLLMGKSIYSIPKSPLSRGHSADYSGDSFASSCKALLDNDQFIGYRFQDDGYVTMMSEDWALGVFNWPDCKGFSKKPVDHYMRPFQLRVESKNSSIRSPDMFNIVYQDSCRETYHYQIQYLKDFLKTYSDKPKFSLTWMTYLSHDDQNSLSHADNFFYHFFNNTKSDFDNSFLFVMGDHGNRFGKVRQTNVGEAEDNNPFLFFSVPKKLRRDDELMDNLRENANQLITHYDTYATLVEIVQPQNPRISNPIIKGSSLFHPLPQPRTCDRLRIPFEYCICDAKKGHLQRNNNIGEPAAKLMVAKMNMDLAQYPETKDCVVLSLDNDTDVVVDEFVEKTDLMVYRVTFSTLPGKGKFWGLVSQNSVNGTFNILSDRFPRLNAYGPQATCASQAIYASYCYCKSLLHQLMDLLKS